RRSGDGLLEPTSPSLLLGASKAASTPPATGRSLGPGNLIDLPDGPLSKQYPKSENSPYGCYTWRHGLKMWEELGREVGRDKESWGPLQAGLFGGSLERYMQASEALRKKQEPFIAQMLHFR
ncbi:MAG TPA: hypothetical protein VH593_29635, partial [Ktedonobacteraceae bacterium]